MSDTSKLQTAVMERITSGDVCPRSRGWFTCLECFVYTFWFISVLVGAVALAVLFYIVVHGWYSFYELTGMSRMGLVLAYLPLFWVVILVATVALAYKNFRRTRRGYRYPVWLVLVACIGMSFIGGAALYWLGVGQLVDTELGERMPAMYESYVQSEAKFWDQPHDHRWYGTLASTSAGWMLTDRSGAEWMVNFAHIPLAAAAVPHDGALVYLLGTSTKPGVVTACAVTRWPADAVRTTERLAHNRFLLRAQLHTHQLTSGPCTPLAAVSVR
jgi:hypothetical protein